jgi:hypothetical protein
VYEQDCPGLRGQVDAHQCAHPLAATAPSLPLPRAFGPPKRHRPGSSVGACPGLASPVLPSPPAILLKPSITPLLGARPPRGAAPGQARGALTPAAAPPRPCAASPRTPRSAPAREATPRRPTGAAARSGSARSAPPSSAAPRRAAPRPRPCAAPGQAAGERGDQGGGPARRGGLPAVAPARPGAPGGPGWAGGSASGIWQAPAGSSQELAARSSAGLYAAAAGAQAPAAAAPSA